MKHLPVAVILTLFLAVPSPSLAINDSLPIVLHQDVKESSSKPFWLEKVSFVHEGDIFAVGVSYRAHVIAQGRLEAFEAGKRELERFFNDSRPSLGEVRTVDLYEEVNLDGSFNVYRLLSVPIPGEKERLESEKRARESRVQHALEMREKAKIEQLIELERREHIEADAKRKIEEEKQRQRDEIAQSWKEWYEEREWSSRSKGNWNNLIDCLLMQLDEKWNLKKGSVDCDDMEKAVQRATKKGIQDTVKQAWSEKGL